MLSDASLAHPVEHRTFNPQVVGSRPTRRTSNWSWAAVNRISVPSAVRDGGFASGWRIHDVGNAPIVSLIFHWCVDKRPTVSFSGIACAWATETSAFNTVPTTKSFR